MRTIRTKIYKFNELSKDVQNKVIERNWDINVNDEWWEFIYEDAANIGLKITGFDLDRGNYCDGKFMWDVEEVAGEIFKQHGKECETYKTASSFMADRDALVAKHSDGVNLEKVAEDNEWEFDNELDELEKEFLRSLLEDYRIILQKEYECMTSEKAIMETIISNEMEFTADGKMF